MNFRSFIFGGKRKWIVVVLVLGVAAALTLCCRPAKPNVLVILIDTLRADHLTPYGYERDTSPVLAKFAKENLQFNWAISPSSWTAPSVASLFTGVYPSVHGFMPLPEEKGPKNWTAKISDQFELLAETFQRNGYQTSAVIGNPVVSTTFGFAQGFEQFLTPGNVSGRKINPLAEQLLDSMKGSEKPFFLYLHYMDPHSPYDPPDRFHKFHGSLEGRSYPEKVNREMRLYDGEISYVDYKIGQVFDQLKARGLYDDMVILIIADHGEQFMEHGFQGHSDKLFQEEVHVPLLLKAPGHKGKVDTIVSSIDVYPTLLEVAGIDRPENLQGFSLVSQLEERKKTGVLSEILRHHNLKAYTSPESKKYIATYEIERGLILTDFDRVMREEAYDFKRDTTESSPVTEPSQVEPLRDQFHDHYSEALKLHDKFHVEHVPTDEKSIEQLKTLGYF